MSLEKILLDLLLKEPFYGSIAQKLTIKETNKIKRLKLLIYPDFSIIYNPLWYNLLPENLKKGIILHELLHIILKHNTRRNNRDIYLWATACDIVVNQYIEKELIIPETATIEEIAYITNKKLEYYQTAEYYYNEIKNIKMTSKYKSENIEDYNSSNPVLKQVQSDIMKSLNTNIKILPENLKKRISEINKEANINWRIILKKFLTKRGKINQRKSYKRESRRYEGFPGTIKSNGVKVLIALDESASMPETVVEEYVNKIADINKITGVEADVIRFDSECTPPTPLKEYLKISIRLKKGSTDYNPIFKLADQYKYRQIIVITDGEGILPESINQEVLWILIKGGKVWNTTMNFPVVA